ncbi:hypothetical protein NX02_00965 [Sphingomonas sanxanigenens DSM 19645 = NX02]|uniref:Lycopene cyclase n=2 Tax=Sphingomonas sanxanigenens TaxID=397260 RepID=W0A1Z9_9SPHN|nr:hypothetical protein NX02_00965 [Sphingomonas sanxanigenens DSM 19645 = NX02]
MYAPAMARTRDCDLLIVGAGLAGGLIALALAHHRPGLDVVLVGDDPAIGGNHVWSFFDSDLDAAGADLVAPLIAHRWQGYDVRFPSFARTLRATYHSIESERLDAAVRAALPADRIRTGRRVLTTSATAAVLDDGSRIEAAGLIDARGASDLTMLDLGWQKFVGQELVLAAPHGLERPIVMDASVPQIDGYRFVYCLPFGPDRVFVEDTYYSDGPVLDVSAIGDRIAAYAAQQGWSVASVGRVETGVLPVAMGGDFEGYWRAGGEGVAKAGVRAGLFHPTTGYSLPDAVATALLIARMPDLDGAALHDRLHAHARARWRSRGYYRMLARMLFRAGAADERYRMFDRFYRLDERLVERFYAAHSTLGDKARLLAGKPPVSVMGAIRAIAGGQVGAEARA